MAHPVLQVRSNLRNSLVLLVVAVIVVIFKVGIVDRFDTPLRRSNLVNGRLERVDTASGVVFGDEFVLLGYDSLPSTVESGKRFEVKTYWRALQSGGPNYGVTVHVVDRYGRYWEDIDIRPPRWHRTPPPVSEWPPDQYALIALSVPLQVGTPPGAYTVELVAFDRATLVPLTAYDTDGRALGPSFVLGQIDVQAPHRPPDVAELGLQQPLNVTIGPLTLLDAGLDRETAASGEGVSLRLLWRAEEDLSDDWSLCAYVVAADGSVVLEYRFPPATEWYPTSLWNNGDVWRGQHGLRLPAWLESGRYKVQIELCRDTGGGESLNQTLDIGQLEVTAPERTFTVPPLDVEANARLGEVVTLLGAILQPSSGLLYPGEVLTVTLVWRAEAEMVEPQRVFLHLLDGSGRIVAQSDGEPANWTRPTTGWLPGEVVLDLRTLNIPDNTEPGEYILQAGMYTLTGGRMRTVDGRDAVELAALQIGEE